MLTGLGVMLGGFLVSWIMSWFLYGYGELIDKTSQIERNTRGLAGMAFGQNVQERYNDPQNSYSDVHYETPKPNVSNAYVSNTQMEINEKRAEQLEKLRSKGLITEEEYRRYYFNNNNSN